VRAGNILRKAPLTKQHVSRAIAAAWSRITVTPGRGQFADHLEISTGTVDNAMTGKTVPELHTALNSLLFDPTALDEVLALYGFRLAPSTAEAANDMALAAGVTIAMGQLVAALSDGRRDHTETLTIADLLRPHLPAITAIVREADQLRGAA
jgi:hypothetical protein